MNKNEIIIYRSEEDNAFIAEVPELPGCMADGKTYQEAVSNAEIIIKEWIETAKELGHPIPHLCMRELSEPGLTGLKRLPGFFNPVNPQIL